MPRQIAADHLAGTVADVALPEWDDTTRTVTTYDASGNWATGNIVTASLNFATTQDWPTTLPGTAA